MNLVVVHASVARWHSEKLFKVIISKVGHRLLTILFNIDSIILQEASIPSWRYGK